MFLLADVFVPSAFPAPELLEEEPTVQRVVSTINPSLDTYIDSDYPNDDHAGEDTGLLGASGTSEARLLISFPLSYASTDTIHSARFGSCMFKLRVDQRTCRLPSFDECHLG